MEQIDESATDGTGRSWKFVYDMQQGGLIEVQNPLQTEMYPGRKTTFTYGTFGSGHKKIKTVTLNDNAVGLPEYTIEMLAYDNKERPSKIRGINGSLMCLTRDGQGNLTSYRVVKATTSNPTPTDCDAQGLETRYIYDPSLMLSIPQDPSEKRLLRQVIFPEGNSVSFLYDDYDRVEFQKSMDVQGNEGFGKQYFYDCRRNVKETDDIDYTQGGIVVRKAKRHFDPIKNLLDGIEDPVTGVLTSFEYDSFLRDALSVDPLGSSMESSYDTYSRLMQERWDGYDGLIKTTDYMYDSGGNVVLTQTTLNGSETVIVEETHDALGRVTQRDDPDGARFGQEVSYDPLGNPLNVATHTVSGIDETITWQYDATARLILTSSSGGNASQSLSLKTPPYSVHTLSRYDNYPGMQPNVTAMLNQAGTLGIVANQAYGRLVQVETREGDSLLGVLASRQSYFYDGYGRPRVVLTERLPLEAYTASGTLSDLAPEVYREVYGWNENGNLVYYELPCNSAIDPKTGQPYDPICDRITLDYEPTTQTISAMTLYHCAPTTPVESVTGCSSQGLVLEADISPNGLETLILGDNIEESREYDLAGRITELNASPLLHYTYVYDPSDGSRLKEVHDGLDSNLSVRYDFDSLDRLFQVSKINNPSQNSTFTYDLNGNRIGKIIPGENSTYDHLTESNRLMYFTTNGVEKNIFLDEQGRTTFDGAHEYLYNALSDLVYAGNGLQSLYSASPSQILLALSNLWLYRYNESHQRVTKVRVYPTTLSGSNAYGIDGRTFLYDIFGNLVRERTLDRKKKLVGTTEQRTVKSQNYYYLGSRLIGTSTKNIVLNNTPQSAQPKDYFIHTDHRGAVLSVADKWGIPQVRIAYDPLDPFGSAILYPLSATAPSMPWRLPGHYFDAESGLYYNWHRYYNPSWGRYLAPDRIVNGRDKVYQKWS